MAEPDKIIVRYGPEGGARITANHLTFSLTKQGVSSLSEQLGTRADRWTPVSEKLPEERLCYLVTYRYMDRLIVADYFWTGEKWKPIEEDWGEPIEVEILAWMEYPPAYQPPTETKETSV